MLLQRDLAKLWSVTLPEWGGGESCVFLRGRAFDLGERE